MGAKDFLFFMLLCGSLGVSVYAYVDTQLLSQPSGSASGANSSEITSADIGDLAARIDDLHGRFDTLEQQRESQVEAAPESADIRAALDRISTRMEKLSRRVETLGARPDGGQGSAGAPAVAATKEAVIEAYKQIEQDKIARKIAKKREATLNKAAKSIDDLAATVDIGDGERQALLSAVENAFDQKAQLKKNPGDDLEEAQQQAKEIDLQLQRDIESILGPDRYEEVYVAGKRDEWRREDERTTRALESTLSRFGKARGLSEGETSELQRTISDGLSQVYELQRQVRPTRDDPALNEEIKQAATSLESDLRARLGDEGFQQLRQEYRGNFESLKAAEK